MLTLGVAQDPSFQDKVSLKKGKQCPELVSQRNAVGEWEVGGGPHLVPSFQWPLPPLEEVSLTDSRSTHVPRTLPSGLDLCLQVVDHFPVFD